MPASLFTPPAGHQDQILQALADITNRLNTFSDLSNSAAIDLIQDRLTTNLGKINVFINTPSTPAYKPIATIKQTEHPTLYPQPHIPQSYPNSIADLRDFDDIHSNIHDPGSDTSHYSTTSAVNTPPQPSATSPQANNPWQMIETEQLSDLLQHLRAKDVEINLLNFQLNNKKENNEHNENNRRLRDDIDTLRSDKRKGDDHLQKLEMANSLLRNKIADLEKKNKDTQGVQNKTLEQLNERERSSFREIEEYKKI